MKLTNTLSSSKSTKGMTLLELTVVILVLLSLISILFVGARAWKKGSDRSANIMNIRNTQQAMRGYQNMYQKKAGDDFTAAMLVDYVKMPTAPTTDIVYTAGTKITPMSVTDGTNIWLGLNAAAKEGGAYGADAGATTDW